MRISSNTIINRYKRNLFESSAKMDRAAETAVNGRKFQHGWENPSEASRAYRLRKDILQNRDWKANLKDVQGKLNSIEDTLKGVNSELVKVTKEDILRVMNGTNQSPEIREIVANKLDNVADTVVRSLNSSYQGQYLFAGSDITKPPLEFAADGSLQYRGENVNAITAPKEEHYYIDLGFGLDANNLDSTSYDMIAGRQAIEILGYGKTDDGTNRNIVSLLKDISKELRNPNADSVKIQKWTTQLEQSQKGVMKAVTDIGAESNHLAGMENRLENDYFNMFERQGETEFMPFEEAFVHYEMAKFSNNVALKVGSNILTPSFIDFMR